MENDSKSYERKHETDAATGTPETATQYLARRNALEAPLRGCGCAHCCEAIARLRARAATSDYRTATEYILREFRESLRRVEAAALRAISYERACASPAAVHCASTDRRDHLKDPGPAPEITRADIDAEKAIQSALEAARVSAHSDAGPAGTD